MLLSTDFPAGKAYRIAERSLSAFHRQLPQLNAVGSQRIGRDRGGRRGTYISTMPSGRLAGISVKPFPRQSTMLLLQVQAEGQEMELALQEGGSEWGPVGPEHSGQLGSVSGVEWAPGAPSPATQ